MSKRITTVLGAALALPLLLTGCDSIGTGTKPPEAIDDQYTPAPPPPTNPLDLRK